MTTDELFQHAVTLIGSGDVPARERLLADHPQLAQECLTAPGAWLRDKIGGALDGVLKDPYLLWFVAEACPSSVACRRTLHRSPGPSCGRRAARPIGKTNSIPRSTLSPGRESLRGAECRWNCWMS
jgi:hypothetical protein